MGYIIMMQHHYDATTTMHCSTKPSNSIVISKKTLRCRPPIKLDCASESPGGLVQAQTAWPHPRDSDFSSLERCLRIYISNKFPEGTDAVFQGHTWETSVGESPMELSTCNLGWGKELAEGLLQLLSLGCQTGGQVQFTATL